MADILKAEGNEAFQAQKYADADRLYSSAITLDPENAVLYSNRAITLIKLEHWDESIQVCDTGLMLNPEKKTRIKLLWRRGVALVQLKQFEEARNCYNEALELDPANTMVFKRLEELNKSQIKRSHSIEEQRADKRPKKLENIPIYEVDELPDDFRVHSALESTQSICAQRSSPAAASVSKPITQTSSAQPQLKLSSPPIPSSPPVLDFPEQPTLHQFTSIIKTPSFTTYQYAFSLSLLQIKKLFSTFCIEPMILNFYLDAINNQLQSHSTLETAQKALSILDTLSRAPRFSLVNSFVAKTKLSSVESELSSLIAKEDLNRVLKCWK
jgi:tetratricopeptide (TPR) repeat protein